MNKTEYALAIGLAVYLLAVGFGAVAVLVINFPTEKNGVLTFPHLTDSTSKQSTSKESTPKESTPSMLSFGRLQSSDQALLLLALFAGMAGSFLHAAQSLSSYVGNGAFKSSWTMWFCLRPWIGGMLGFAIYFVLRAGLLTGNASLVAVVNPYGVVALGFLGGWFSKITTDKLQEVFETLFRTDEDRKRKNKLLDAKRPIVNSVEPSPVPAGTSEIMLLGSSFLEGATVLINGNEIQAEYVSETKLKVNLGNLTTRPPPGTQSLIMVKNPEGLEPVSKKLKIAFQ